MQKIRNSSQQLLALIGAMAIVLLLTTAAIANSPAPPERHWLKFDRHQPAFEGVQIVQCESTQCQKPVLIMRYKTCIQTGCLPGGALVEHMSDSRVKLWNPHFACVDNTCFWSFRNLDLGKSHNFNPNLLKIVAQYPDRVRSSSVFKLLTPQGFDPPTDIAIAVGTTDLRVSQTTNKEKYSASNESNWTNLAPLAILVVSVGSELLIAYFYFRRQHPTGSQMRLLLRSVLMVHLFSLAIVWASFPALAAFRTTGIRTAGIAWIAMSLVYGLLVTGYYTIGKQPKKISTWVSGTIWFWLLSLVVSFCCSLLDYGVSLPLTTDIFLPAAWILPTSEIFIWLYEAWIIYAVNKGSIDYRQAICLSFCTNSTSFLLGLGAIEIGNYFMRI